jgi:hypothetical protein
MQVLDSLEYQLSQLPRKLQISLDNIVNNLQIESFYSIQHPEYNLVSLPESVISRFQNLPLDIQHKHLSIQLRNFLYSAYYNGSWHNSSNADDQMNNLSNNSLFGIDLTFYEKLHNRNTGIGYWSKNWLVVNEEADKMPKNLVQNGFYMAVSNLGTQDHQDILRIYFNISPEGTVSVMENLTKQLNKIAIPFSFKALYNPDEYGRYDSAVLYFNKHEYQNIYSVLQSLYLENKSYFSPQVPLFTKALAPGLGCAEEPENKLAEKESFGTNRCQMIANGLINAWQIGNNQPEQRIRAIFEQFALHKIKIQYPYLNTHSEDIYTPLEDV